MVYVQIKSAHLISRQCIGDTFNERVSLKPFHCQKKLRAKLQDDVIYCRSCSLSGVSGENLFSFCAVQS